MNKKIKNIKLENQVAHAFQGSDLRVTLNQNGGIIKFEAGGFMRLNPFLIGFDNDPNRIVEIFKLKPIIERAFLKVQGKTAFVEAVAVSALQSDWIINIKAAMVIANTLYYEIYLDFICKESLQDFSAPVSSGIEQLTWLQDIIENLQSATAIVDAKTGQIKMVNNRASSLLRMPEKKLIGLPFQKLAVDNFNVTKLDDYISEIYDTGNAFISRLAIPFKAGERPIEIDIRANMVRISDYKYIMLSFSESRIHDQLEESVPYSHFKALFDENNSGLLMADINGDIFSVNSAFSRITGYGYNEVVGSNWRNLGAQLFGEELTGTIAHKLEKSGSIKNNEVLVTTDNGQQKWVSMTSLLVNGDSGKELFFIVSLTDINKERIADLRVKEQKTLIESISNNVNDGIYRSSSNGKLIFANQAFINKFGFESYDSIKQIEISNFYAQVEDRKILMSNLQENGRVEGMECLLKQKDGSTFWALINCSATQLGNGEFVIDGVIRDITNRKEAEKKLIDKNLELGLLNKELDNLIYSVSHDLRAPLLSILGLINLSQQSSEIDAIKEYLEMMASSVSKLDTFVKDTIAYSKKNSTELTSEKVDFSLLLKEIWSELEFMDNSNTIEFRTNIEPNLTIESDRHRLKVILSNLISNAIRYHRIENNEPYIEVTARRYPNGIHIVVMDNGEGIDVYHHSKIFDMYYRTTYDDQGTGLGLYIVKETVEKLNGQIKLESQKGSGSKFHIHLSTTP